MPPLILKNIIPRRQKQNLLFGNLDAGFFEQFSGSTRLECFAELEVAAWET
jgi:hypothetical protein